MSNTAEIHKEDYCLALTELLSSNTLRRSAQLRAILKYICEATIEGREQDITEYVIGVEVLHRRPPYNPTDDSVVRTRVYELRQKLALYYEKENPSARIRIEIPKGGYVPQFVPAIASDSPQVDPSRARWKWGLAAIVLVLASCGIFAFLETSQQRYELDVWGPLIHSSVKPIVICFGESMPFATGDPSDSKSREDYSLYYEKRQRVGTGAAVTLFRLGALFHQFHAQSQLRQTTTTSYADMHRYPMVLIGALSNQFTLDATHDLRYHFEGSKIVDAKQPSSIWQPAMDSAGKSVRDYGIAARLMQNDSHQPLIIMAGIEQCGTEASSEVLSDALPDLAKKMPHGWKQKNFEVLVAVQVVDGSCGAPEILRVDTW